MTVLVLVDAQRTMLLPPDPVPDADRVTALLKDLLERGRVAGVPVVHVRDNGGDDDPDRPGTTGWELVFDAHPGEAVVDKHQPDAFAGTNLADLIPPAALDRGHRVTLVRGAHATYDGDLPARQVSQRIEAELSDAGVALANPDGLPF
jgi:nicotinamidase-related amidase